MFSRRPAFAFGFGEASRLRLRRGKPPSASAQEGRVDYLSRDLNWFQHNDLDMLLIH